MAPIAITTTSSLTSPPGAAAAKSQIAASNKDQSLSLDVDGASTPYSSTSTAVSEKGEPSAKSKLVVDENLPPTRPSPKDDHYFSNLIASSLPTPSTKPGSTVYGSAIAVVEALAVKYSSQVWAYDDASAVGFGSAALNWAKEAQFGADATVQAVQTRPGAGQEIAGYIKKASGKVSVFASVSTLPLLLPALESLEGDIVINLATTAPNGSLVLTDSLFAPGVIKSLASLDWDVILSSGSDIVDNAASIYGSSGKVVHVIESTCSGQEITSFAFPISVATQRDGLTTYNPSAGSVYVVLEGHLASVVSTALPPGHGLVALRTLSPSPKQLRSVLTGKSVSVVGGTRTDAEALKAVILSTLYSASSSSTSVLPSIKTVVAKTPGDLVTLPEPKETKTIAFYTAPLAPLPQLMAHLFLSSPSLKTRLAQYGSSSTRGLKSILALSPASVPTLPLAVDEAADVTWVSDANVLKSTNVLSSAKPGGVLVLELPWTEEEVPIKLSRTELISIKEKQLRVFLLDLNPAAPLNPIREQVAFLLLYTGKEKLSAGIRKVLDAFHSGYLGRDEVEDAQAGLIELDTDFAVPELEEGKSDKVKDTWEWDALPGEAGVVDLDEDTKPTLSGSALVAKHLFFREAFAADAKTVAEKNGPSITALRPSMTDETFLVKVSENRRLTPQTYDRNVFHLELDTAGTGLKYEIGEAIGIHGWNDAAEVLDFCKWYGLDPDTVVSFPNPLAAHTMESRTVFQLLQQNVDLFGRPGKAFYAALAKLATSKADAMTLKFISVPEGAELFKRMAEKETVTFADVLYRFRTARPGIEELVGLIPEIKPRHYSIASSQKAIGDKVELLIVTVDWINSKGSPRYGQCTRYLAALRPGDNVTVSIKPSVMKLPPDDRQPIIMAGLGTGAAPFRAFMQHRAWQRSQGVEVGPLIYYFGSRYRSQEYLYGEEIEAYLASGIISHAGLAFSRDGKDKVYIQHKMMQDKKMLAEMLLGEEERAAYFYLCGPTWPVPDVYEALVGSLNEEGGMEREHAERFIEELKEEERYVLEVY